MAKKKKISWKDWTKFFFGSPKRAALSLVGLGMVWYRLDPTGFHQAQSQVLGPVLAIAILYFAYTRFFKGK